MKRKLVFVALLATVVAGLSSCYVEGQYGYRHHYHDYDHRYDDHGYYGHRYHHHDDDDDRD